MFLIIVLNNVLLLYIRFHIYNIENGDDPIYSFFILSILLFIYFFLLDKIIGDFIPSFINFKDSKFFECVH